jgi:flagellar protein FlaI
LILEHYPVKVDNAEVGVKIVKDAGDVSYKLDFPVINIATAALLDEIRQELISSASVGITQAFDKESLEKMKKRFISEATKIMRDIVPSIDRKIEDFLVGKLMQDMLGLGEVEFLINDPDLEEVVIPSSNETIRAYHKKYGWLRTNLKVASEDAILNYANIIARRVGRQITVLTPLLDAHIVSGDRTNAVLYPISTKGNTITIRKFARDPWTIVELIKNGTCNIEIAALIWLAMEYEMNVIVSGGTASGKTVFMNSCMCFMPPNHRIISIEDTRELTLPEHLYWTPLVTRIPNVEGKGEVNMLDLLVNSLRMRPDRIILGEMRRQREAEVLFEAMHTGHSVYATLHADSAAETINRLTNPPINVPKNLLGGVNLNIVMFRDRRKGVRRVFQISEFIVGKDDVSAHLLYRYIPEKDVIQKHGESMKLYEELNRHTGMSNNEINNELKKRRDILEWMVKNNLSKLDQVSRIMSYYYSDKEGIIKLINKNKIKEILGTEKE